jgi:hypothetical protein
VSALPPVILAFVVQAGTVKRETAPAAQVGYFHDLRLGLKYIARHKVVATLFLFNGAMMIMAAPVAMLSPLQVTRLFGADAWRLAAVDIGFSAGMLLGGLVLMSWGGFKNRHGTITLGAYIFAVCNVIFGLLNSFWLFHRLYGGDRHRDAVVFNAVCHTAAGDGRAGLFGRSSAFRRCWAASPCHAGLLVFGPLADVVGLDVLFILTGAYWSYCRSFHTEQADQSGGAAAAAHGKARDYCIVKPHTKSDCREAIPGREVASHDVRHRRTAGQGSLPVRLQQRHGQPENRRRRAAGCPNSKLLHRARDTLERAVTSDPIN